VTCGINEQMNERTEYSDWVFQPVAGLGTTQYSLVDVES